MTQLDKVVGIKFSMNSDWLVYFRSLGMEMSFDGIYKMSTVGWDSSINEYANQTYVSCDANLIHELIIVQNKLNNLKLILKRDKYDQNISNDKKVELQSDIDYNGNYLNILIKRTGFFD